MINFINVSIPISDYKDTEYLGDKIAYRFNSYIKDNTVNAVECIVSKDNFSPDDIAKKYREYKDRFKNIQINRVKANKLNQLINYDTSSEVRKMTINNVDGWLDKEQRSGLYNLLNTDIDIINLWFGGVSFALDKPTLKRILDNLEQYAYECYNITALHKQKVSELTNIDEIENYDITAYYPKPLNITL